MAKSQNDLELREEKFAWQRILYLPPGGFNAKYQQHLGSVKGKDPRERAEAWLKFVSSTLEGGEDYLWDPVDFCNLEAQVYLAARGLLADGAEDHIRRCWLAAEEFEFERFKSKAGESGPPPQVINEPSDRLHNFWEVQEDPAETSAVLRTTDFCGIAGFEAWWERFKGESHSQLLSDGVDSLHQSPGWWCFCMARSDYAVELLGETLVRAMEHGVQPLRPDEPASWVQILDLEAGETIFVREAASFAFAAARLRPDFWGQELRTRVWHDLQTSLNDEGYWEDGRGSIVTTATAIHALASGKPQGWKGMA